jgi:DNA-binding NarL/FixJ family response regulator
MACVTSTVSFGSEVYSLRALLLDNDTGPNDSPPIMVLIESISPAQRFDLEKARDRYQLTFKEKEVVQLLFQGFTNKEVAKELCIGAYTLKDHLKNIRQKMGVYTRTGILSKVVQL